MNKIQNLISTIVIGSMATAFAAEKSLSSKCHGAGNRVSDIVMTIPVFDPIIFQVTEDVSVFKGRFTLINAEKYFIINVTNKEQFNFVTQIQYIDKRKADCYAEYDWKTDSFKIPYVYLPSVVVLPSEDSQDGSFLNI
ncbi:hypothetical protein [Candidatus Marithrix sp. Canyon 246]|uniref:hypothetical protein n=1 Tax=Candidatus Marithrix sp. Canyon 246 TaxID=1827136 RepID=UPI000849FE32|nr:hypothetical protein [Candidatus Marithrix sp. Canyon 246]